MSGSQPCKHAWLAGREVVSASVSVKLIIESSLSALSTDRPHARGRWGVGAKRGPASDGEAKRDV